MHSTTLRAGDPVSHTTPWDDVLLIPPALPVQWSSELLPSQAGTWKFAALQEDQEPKEPPAPQLSTKALRKKQTELRRKKWYWYGGSAAFAVVGAYFRYSADQHYEEYQSATGDATELHRIIEMEDTIYPIGYGLSAACLLTALSYHVQEIQVKHQIQTVESANLGLSWRMEVGW